MKQELPGPIIIDLCRDLHDRVVDQIKMKISIVDHPKDKFRVSLGALSATLGSISGAFAAAYGLPKSGDMGRQLAMAILDLGEKVQTMTPDEWAAFVERNRA
jgi:hypothetical protein